MIELINVGMRYGASPEILSDVNLILPEGSFCFLTGPSGAGKSSLLRLLYLAQKPTRGQLRLFGKDVVRVPTHEFPYLRRRVGVVYQNFNLIPHLSVFDNVALPMRIAEIKENKIKENVTDLLNWVGLGRHLNARPRTLSGGEQQRAAIARAVIGRPDILLADEPTGSVDEETGAWLMKLFYALNKQRGTTVVIGTHDMKLAHSPGMGRIQIEDGQVRLYSNDVTDAS